MINGCPVQQENCQWQKLAKLKILQARNGHRSCQSNSRVVMNNPSR